MSCFLTPKANYYVLNNDIFLLTMIFNERLNFSCLSHITVNSTVKYFMIHPSSINHISENGLVIKLTKILTSSPLSTSKGYYKNINRCKFFMKTVNANRIEV